MMGSFSLSLMVAALTGMGLGAMGYRVLARHAAMDQRRIPGQWQLRTRPLFTGVERTVWHWLERVFFDHHVLVKIPVIRFLSPYSPDQGQHSHELLQGVYCSFTICADDGTVVGCVDVPGGSGLKASNRDLKKKLFEECGLAYIVLSANQLPTLEVLRAAFLADRATALASGHESATTSQPPLWQPADRAPGLQLSVASPTSQAAPEVAGERFGTAQPGRGLDCSDSPHGIDMTVVAAARNSLQSRLDHNRKVRLGKIDELSAGLGIVDDKADQRFAVPWEDSFIMGEEARKPDKRKD